MSGAAGGFLRARLAALYLLSLTSVTAALAAWRPSWIDGPRAWLPGVVLAFAALAGQAAHDRFSLLADRLGRGRFRSAGASAHGAVVALGLLGLFVRSPQATESAVRGLAVFQPLFLLRGMPVAEDNNLRFACERLGAVRYSLRTFLAWHSIGTGLPAPT